MEVLREPRRLPGHQCSTAFRGSELVVRFTPMKFLNPLHIGGAVLIAVMSLTTVVGAANACHHSAETAEQTSTELPQNADEKAEVEA